MKLKYRIKKIGFAFAEPIFIAQYKIIGLWLNINDRQVGRFLTPPTCYCETIEDAQKRIDIHKENLERAGSWWYGKSIDIVREC